MQNDQAYRIYMNCLRAPHVLIAGATGSGKSVFVSGIISTILKFSPTEKQMVLIDPKMVELSRFRKTAHCRDYADRPENIVKLLHKYENLMMKRYAGMKFAGIVKSPECDVYIIIDELADLMTTNRKEVETPLKRLCQLGRAANIHVIACTQRPTANIITNDIKVNINHRIALHVPTAQDSRNILNVAGAEALPQYGYCIVMMENGDISDPVPVPMIPENELLAQVKQNTFKTFKWF